MNKETLDFLAGLRALGVVTFSTDKFTVKFAAQQQDFNSWNTQDIDNAELLRKLDEGNPLTSSEDDLIYHSSR
jgi:hypothetical protein